MLDIAGQNSFSEHFRLWINKKVAQSAEVIFTGAEKITDMRKNFVAEGIASMIFQWLQSKENIPPHQMMEEIKSCFALVHKLYNEMTK
ncbi:MAG: TetR/AcrR family transcriptional regulator C-terminal domain-containing protein [Oscillospiraceae bacterium]|nr:TetR/AcrR family transcriptional regulator C-terminal domain-containing protein [Oscillospiraceae bacterium]